MCGDNPAEVILMLALGGSPPHVRGPREIPWQEVLSLGITPACAGTTGFSVCSTAGSGDHPRMCGDHLNTEYNGTHSWGSPPHVRGPQSATKVVASLWGITPAGAGTTSFSLPGATVMRDHPRMCGDHLVPYQYSSVTVGSPPHVRGPLDKYIA